MVERDKSDVASGGEERQEKWRVKGATVQSGKDTFLPATVVEAGRSYFSKCKSVNMRFYATGNFWYRLFIQIAKLL